MNFYPANWLGLISDHPVPETEGEVLKIISRPYWPRMNWFYVAEAQTFVTPIRREMVSFPFEIRTEEDLKEALIKFRDKKGI